MYIRSIYDRRSQLSQAHSGSTALLFLSREPDSFTALFFMHAKMSFILLCAAVAFDCTEGISKCLFTTILLQFLYLGGKTNQFILKQDVHLFNG